MQIQGRYSAVAFLSDDCKFEVRKQKRLRFKISLWPVVLRVAAGGREREF